jgi:hypothetical protein
VRLTNLTIMHTAVMIATLFCLTALGIFDVLSGEALAPIFAGIAGVVFGAAASQSASTATERTVVEAAIEHGVANEQDARAHMGGSRHG